MRILLLNQTFHPDVAATAQHGMDLARHLTGRGHKVVVIASRSIYGEKGATLPPNEIIEGIVIHRVGAGLFGKRGGTFGRLVDFLLWYVLATIKAFTVPRTDVCVTFTTPPFIVLIGLLLKWIRKTRLVYWTMDLYPDVAVQHGMLRETALLTHTLEWIHRFALVRTDRIITLGRCMKDRLLAKDIDESLIRVVPVWADRNEVVPVPRAENPLRREWNLGDAFVVMYAGNFGAMHEASTLFEAAGRMQERDDVVFLFVGGGTRMDVAKAYAKQRGLSNMQFQPYQPRERLGELLALGDVHLVSMVDGADGLIVPSKLFGILAAGRPALYVGPEGSEIAQIIMEHDAGRVFAIGDDQSLAACISDLAADHDAVTQMGQNGRDALERMYDRSIACDQIAIILEDVVKGASPSMHATVSGEQSA